MDLQLLLEKFEELVGEWGRRGKNGKPDLYFFNRSRELLGQYGRAKKLLQALAELKKTILEIQAKTAQCARLVAVT